MDDTRLRFAVGIVGNLATLLLFAAPILTFSRVVRKRNTEGFSCIPYITALLNCLLYEWYGLPVVSYGWTNFPLVTINGVGILFELSFVLIFLFFAPPKPKRKAVIMVVAAVTVFMVTAMASTLGFHDRHHRKILVGSVGVVTSVVMFGAPLVAVKQVIETKSVEFMPFYLSFFSFVASSLWLAYGLLSHDLLLAGPNIVGSPLGMLQLGLYFRYKRIGEAREAAVNRWDMEEQKEPEEAPDKRELVVHASVNDPEI